MTRPTPTPWQLHDEDYCPDEIYGDMEGPLEDGRIRGTLVCAVQGDDEELIRANAMLIVRAVNAHDAMLKALQIARPYIGRCAGADPSNATNLAQIDAAIALGEKR